MPNKCRTKHVQIRTNAEQKSLKLVACRAHSRDRINVLKTRNATRSMSNYFFTWRKATTLYELSPTCTRDWMSYVQHAFDLESYSEF